MSLPLLILCQQNLFRPNSLNLPSYQFCVYRGQKRLKTVKNIKELNRLQTYQTFCAVYPLILVVNHIALIANLAQTT